MDLEDVHREALHDWLNERLGLIERPDPSEYEDDDENRPPAFTLTP